MGMALHKIVLQSEKCRCRIYAPVGAHRDLLAYLVRRLLGTEPAAATAWYMEYEWNPVADGGD